MKVEHTLEALLFVHKQQVDRLDIEIKEEMFKNEQKLFKYTYILCIMYLKRMTSNLITVGKVTSYVPIHMLIVLMRKDKDSILYLMILYI